MKKIKEKHIIPKGFNLSEDKFVKDYVLKHTEKAFTKMSAKYEIPKQEFTKYFQENFKVNHYRGKNYNEFINVFFEKAIKPVLEKNGYEVI